MQGVSAVNERCKERKRKVEKTTMESSSNEKPKIYKKHLEINHLRKQHSKIIKSYELPVAVH